MNKNKLIKKNIEFHIDNSIKLFQQEFSFPNLVKNEISNFENITWLPSPGFDIEILKKEREDQLNKLLEDNQLHSKLNNILKELVNINEKINNK